MRRYDPDDPPLSPVEFDEGEVVAGRVVYKGRYENRVSEDLEIFELTLTAPVDLREEVDEFGRALRVYFEAADLIDPDADTPVAVKSDATAVRAASTAESDMEELEEAEERIPEDEAAIAIAVAMLTEGDFAGTTWTTVRRSPPHRWEGPDLVRIYVSGGQVRLGGVKGGAQSHKPTGSWSKFYDASRACVVNGEQNISSYRLNAGWHRA